MIRPLPFVSLCLGAALIAQQDPRAAYVAVDYAKVERSIRVQPDYIAAPLYAMFVFDLKGQHRVWCALDKSDTELAYYDVLYMDLDGDGDLTEVGERFTGKYDEKMARAGMGLSIRVGDVKVPGTDLVHTKFLVSTIRKPGRKGIWFRMHWNGKYEMSGGYGKLGSDVTMWAVSPATAPILRPCPFGPLSFATWGDDEIALRAGQEAHINVIAGNRGDGVDAMAVVDENFLDLARDQLLVTVVARDRDGNEVTETSRIDEHC